MIATLRWVRLVHKCQIVKYWKQIESIRAFMRECAWRYAPASVDIDVQVGLTSILVLSLYLCQHLILDFVNSINYNHLAHINVLYTARLSTLLRSKKQRGRHNKNCLSLISYAQRSNVHRCACDWHKSRCLFDLNSLPRRAVYKT